MLTLLIQLLMICCMILLAAMPIAFLVLTRNYVVRRTRRRGVLITGAFLIGAWASGFLVWQLIPSDWSFSFWTTLEAAGDAQKYGHPIEHYAECVVVILIFAATLGGAAIAGVAALTARFGKQRHRAYPGTSPP